MSKNSQDHFVGGLGLGLVAGTGMALLFATKRGNEWRQKLATIVNEVKAEMEKAEKSGEPASPNQTTSQTGMLVGNPPALDSPIPPPTLRGLLESFYEVIKIELNDMAKTPKPVAKTTPKIRSKKIGKFKNIK